MYVIWTQTGPGFFVTNVSTGPSVQPLWALTENSVVRYKQPTFNNLKDYS
jgi:hypothetical protein